MLSVLCTVGCLVKKPLDLAISSAEYLAVSCVPFTPFSPDRPEAAKAAPGIVPNAVSTASFPSPSVKACLSSKMRCVTLAAKDGTRVSACSPSTSAPARAVLSLAPPVMDLPARVFSRPVEPDTLPITPPSSWLGIANNGTNILTASR